MSSLQNKIVAVTGSSGLLGSAFVAEIRKSGGKAYELDLKFPTEASEFQISCDITQPESVKNAIEHILGKEGRIDGWVNNAYPRTSDWGLKFEQIPFASWQKNVDMHMNGYFNCCQQILEVMRGQGSGSVVNLGSIYGVLGPDFTIYEGTQMTNAAGYAAIKGGIINLTRYLAAYYGPFGVRVNALSPGGIFDNQPESFVKAYESKTPLKRMGLPKDIAPPMVFLLSDAAQYITGQNLLVDGGWTAV